MNNNDSLMIWESAADASFTIAEDKDGEQLGRGTMITLTLKEDAQEFLDESKLKEVVSKYSEFINYPIYLWTSYEEEVEVAIEDEDEEEAEEESAADEKKEEGAEDDEFDFEEGTTSPPPRRSRKPATNGRCSTSRRPSGLATRPTLRRMSTTSSTSPLRRTRRTRSPTHFKAEGEVEFRSILYIPELRLLTCLTTTTRPRHRSRCMCVAC